MNIGEVQIQRDECAAFQPADLDDARIDCTSERLLQRSTSVGVWHKGAHYAAKPRERQASRGVFRGCRCRVDRAPQCIHPTQSNRIGLRVCSAHIPRSGTAAIRTLSNVTMYGPY